MTDVGTPALGAPLMQLDFEALARLRQPLVYVWSGDDVVLYIGASGGGIARPLARSHEKLRDFAPGDRLALFPVPHARPPAFAELFALEAELIQRLRPRWNGNGGPRRC